MATSIELSIDGAFVIANATVPMFAASSLSAELAIDDGFATVSATPADLHVVSMAGARMFGVGRIATNAARVKGRRRGKLRLSLW